MRPTSDRSDLPAVPPLTARKRRAFVAVVVLLPWLGLLLLEVGLRFGGYGGSLPLFVTHAAQPGYLVMNDEVARRWFADGTFLPTPETDFFRARKAPRTFRIFFQGESSAQGFPYGHGGAPSRMLEQRLQATFPDREIEVVNTALTAVNSWTLLDQASEIIEQHPDAVLIYTGHNEYYGALGVSSARTIGRSRTLVKAYLLHRHVRTAQLLAAGVRRAGRALRRQRDTAAPRTVMQLMAGGQLIPYDSPRYREGIDQLRANLGELLARYHARGIPVFIGTVASNARDQPPFIGSEAANRYARARAAEARGDTTGAREGYRWAKDLDELRFRAPEEVNIAIREQAARHGAIVVGTEHALQRASPGGVVGHSLMLEHVHPNLDGYFLIADAFYDALRARRMIGDWAASVPAANARRAVAVTPIDSLVGAYRTDRLVSGWPFRPRGAERTPIVDTLTPRSQVERLARAVVLGELPWPEATERLRVAAERAGDYPLAIDAARALAQEYSWSPQPWQDAARAAILAHRYDDALAYVREAIARRETPNEVQLAGLLLLREDNFAEALPYLARAVELAPSDQRMALTLRAAGTIPAQQRQRAAAPRDTIARYELAAAYAITQQYERAREVVRELQRIAPNHAGARSLSERLPK